MVNVMVLEPGAFGSELGINAIIKETLKSSLDPSSLRVHSKKSTVWSPEEGLPQKHAGTLTLDFSLQICDIQISVVSKQLSSWNFCQWETIILIKNPTMLDKR